MSCGLQVLFSNCHYFDSSNSSSPLSLLRSHYFLYFFILRSHYFFYFLFFLPISFCVHTTFPFGCISFFSRLHFILHSYNFSSLRILCSDFYFMCSPYFSYFLILISHCFSYFLFFLLYFIMRSHNLSSLRASVR